jgi:hypothetical protein
VVKLGIIRKIASLRNLIKQRDLIIPLPQRRKPPRKEVMFVNIMVVAGGIYLHV